MPESVRAEGNLRKYGNNAGWNALDQLRQIADANGKSMGQTALAWLLTQPECTAPIIGANHVGQLEEALGAVGYRLSPDQMQVLNDATAFEKNWRPIWDWWAESSTLDSWAGSSLLE